MQQTSTIPWNAWFSEDEKLNLSFPNSWKVTMCNMDDAPGLSKKAIEAAFEAPIETGKIRNLAKGKRTAAIVIDDISRPTRGEDILTVLIDEMEKGGIQKKDIKIIMALGGHRPMMREDLIKKVGEKIYNEVDVMNHYLYENLVTCGESKIGTPIKINRYFMESDLKISVSCIIPHEWAGFGGGSKNIVPGVAGIETLISNHTMVHGSYKGLTGICDPNPLRADIENIAQLIGLDAIVNVVTNMQRDTVGVFVGDSIKAHRKGVELAKKAYATELVYDQDVVILNAFPKDTEILQITNALNIFHLPKKEIVKKDGIIILSSACFEGRGFHAIMGHGTPLEYDLEDVEKLFEGRTGVVFSPNLNHHDMKYYFPDSIPLFNDWEKLIQFIREQVKTDPQVAIYPTASLQLPKD
ncbi:MAG: nickel-dependent lactate racemase [Deltaproteobacteria bacterium]|jgi:lactate racemase|nr:nickel-dependent lactate racemase [Deltaproteobacteria bacterium]